MINQLVSVNCVFFASKLRKAHPGFERRWRIVQRRAVTQLTSDVVSRPRHRIANIRATFKGSVQKFTSENLCHNDGVRNIPIQVSNFKRNWCGTQYVRFLKQSKSFLEHLPL